MLSASLPKSFGFGRNTPSSILFPPIPIAIIHDNFIGTATTSLLNHMPDVVGGSWKDYINTEYPSFTADMFELDGNGNVVLNTNYYTWTEYGAVYNTTTSTASNITIEADLEIIESMQAYAQIFLLFKGDPVDDGQADYFYRFSQGELYLNTNGYVSYIGLGCKGIEGNGISVSVAETVDNSTGTHQLKLVVEGLDLSFYYDNVLLAQRTASELSTGTHFGFTIRTNDDVGRLGFSNFKVSVID